MGFFLAAPAAAGELTEAMTFAMRQGERCPQAGCIAAAGMIGPDTVRDFQKFVKANRARAGAIVELNSPGGDVAGALQLGLILRRHGFNTRVAGGAPGQGAQSGPGICASACAYVFVAGMRRELDVGARLGVHQFSPRLQTDIWETQRLVGVIGDYLDTVGADPKLERLALLTPPDQVHWLTEAEVVKLGVVTQPIPIGFAQSAGPKPEAGGAPNAALAEASRVSQ